MRRNQEAPTGLLPLLLHAFPKRTRFAHRTSLQEFTDCHFRPLLQRLTRATLRTRTQRSRNAPRVFLLFKFRLCNKGANRTTDYGPIMGVLRFTLLHTCTRRTPRVEDYEPATIFVTNQAQHFTDGRETAADRGSHFKCPKTSEHARFCPVPLPFNEHRGHGGPEWKTCEECGHDYTHGSYHNLRLDVTQLSANPLLREVVPAHQGGVGKSLFQGPSAHCRFSPPWPLEKVI